MKKESTMSKVFIKNIGKLVSGDLEKGVLNANEVYIQDRKIVIVGMEDEIRPNGVAPSQVSIEKHLFSRYLGSGK